MLELWINLLWKLAPESLKVRNVDNLMRNKINTEMHILHRDNVLFIIAI